MKLNDGRITMLASENGMIIELRDNDASVVFAKVEMNTKQLAQALSRLGYTTCKIEVQGLDKLGKKMEIDKLVFEIPDDWYNEKELAMTLVKEKCPEGWTPDLYFNSQNSFFIKDGVRFARTTIRRWV